jgi:hypothetical protein
MRNPQDDLANVESLALEWAENFQKGSCRNDQPAALRSYGKAASLANPQNRGPTRRSAPGPHHPFVGGAVVVTNLNFAHWSTFLGKHP